MHLAGRERPEQLELVVIAWFRRWLGYPEGAGGLFTSGGSAASVDAFVAAREAAGHPERAALYMSDQSHSALSRAAGPKDSALCSCGAESPGMSTRSPAP